MRSKSDFNILKFDTWKKILFAYLTLFIFAFGLVVPINLSLNANYLFLMKKPINGFGFLPSGNYYIPSLMLLTFVVFIVTALIYSILNNFKNKTNYDKL